MRHIILWATCLAAIAGMLLYMDYSNELYQQEMQRIEQLQEMKARIGGPPVYYEV